MTDDQVEETTTVTTETTTTVSTETYETSDDAAPLPAHLWPCGCLPNSQAQHRGSCEVFIGGRQMNPGELAEIEHRAQQGQMIPAGEALALVNTIKALTYRVMMQYEETTRALMQARDAERALAAFGPGGTWTPIQADLGRLSRIVELEGQLTHSQGQQTMLRTVIEERDARVSELASQLHQAEEEVGRRYTKDQLGDLQTSEAELVSAPLRARIEVLGADLYEARNRVQEARDLMTFHANRADRLAIDADKLTARIKHLEDPPLRMKLVTELEQRRVLLDSWEQTGQQLRELLHSQHVVDALMYDSYPPDMQRSWFTLCETIRQTRHLVGEQSLRDLAAGATLGNQPDLLADQAMVEQPCDCIDQTDSGREQA